MNWIKQHPCKAGAILGTVLILAGLLMKLPPSPDGVIIVGMAILFIAVSCGIPD